MQLCDYSLENLMPRCYQGVCGDGGNGACHPYHLWGDDNYSIRLEGNVSSNPAKENVELAMSVRCVLESFEEE